ncbi:RNA polymerase sigma-70 factor [Flagellimonas onchidii]|uniref:RNA polymerase sigma-70 factor n=1 Tax=Flagellimonas onchidii TaxID=2562684 RepID=UPI0010A65B2C|nr:RNA polymerase sigma-70 factor [Allomuricauda onchidii]
MSINSNANKNDRLKGVFNEYYKPLVSYACNFIPSTAECQDLVQDVFVTLWEKELMFPDDTSLKVYLYTSVRNKCYNIIKHKRVKDKYVLEAMKSLQDDNLFIKQIVNEEVAKELHNAIEKLPERKKEIIKLSLMGVKNQDIALRLGIKLQTVKTLKSQTYKILREKFKDNAIIINFLNLLLLS